MRIKLRNIIYAIVAIFGMGFFSSCDPYYSISISNETRDTISIALEAHSYFKIIDEEPLDFQEEISQPNRYSVRFRVAPHDTIICGYTMMGLEKELPFSEFRAYLRGDSIIAKNKSEVLALFDRNFLGNWKTPYQLTIK